MLTVACSSPSARPESRWQAYGSFPAVPVLPRTRRRGRPDRHQRPATRVGAGPNWVGRVHNALRIDEWPFRADKGDYALFLGRYAPYKGAHLALRAAHQAGIPLVLAGKCNEPPEQAYFNEQVRPLLTENDQVYGQVDAVSKRKLLAGARCLCFRFSGRSRLAW